jgi:hypothetical protein
MNTKLILATLAGGILYFLLGWVVYGMFLMGFYQANTVVYDGLYKEMPNLILLFLANLAMAFLIAWIFQKWANISTLSGGFTAGLLIGFLIGLTNDLMFYSMMNLYTSTLLFVDIIVAAIVIGIVGACIGWVLGIGKK